MLDSWVWLGATEGSQGLVAGRTGEIRAVGEPIDSVLEKGARHPDGEKVKFTLKPSNG